MSAPAFVREDSFIFVEKSHIHIFRLVFRAQYLDGDVLDTTVSNVRLESAGPRDSGLGKSNFVEKCHCPVGYVGFSCEVFIKKIVFFFFSQM